MIRRALVALARFATAHPGALALACLIPLSLSAYALTVPLDFSFAGVMDRDHPEVARYFEASERYGLGGMLPVLVEGPEPQLDEAVVDLELALDDLDEVQSVLTAPPRDWLLAHAPWFVDADTFDRWVAFAEGEADAEAARGLADALRALEARQVGEPIPGTRLVLVTMTRDTFELALDARDFPDIRSAARAAVAPHGAEVRFAGMPAIITQEQEATLERMRVLGPLSLLLVLGILFFVERRPSMLLAVGGPMLLSVGTTLGLIGLFAGHLTIMEAIFGVIVFGIGIDFAIHLIVRLQQERSAGFDPDAAIERAMSGTGSGIVVAAVTTGGAFLILAAAPDPVFQRLGMAGGLGLLLCLVFLMSLLPPLWRLIEQRSRGETSRGGEFVVLARLGGAAAARPAGVLLLALLALIAAAIVMPRLHYETNLERVFSRDIRAVDTARRIHDLYAIDPGPWLVAVEDVEAARQTGEAFVADPIFDRAESVAALFPGDQDERRRRLAELAPGLAREIRAREEAARSLDEPAAGVERESLDLLSLLLRAEALGPPQLDALPGALADRFIGPDGELLVYAFAAEPRLDSAVAARERRVAQAIDPTATSMNAIYEALVGTDRPWMPPIVAAVALFILGVLYLDLRSLRLALLALLPVAFATILTLGGLAAVGFALNTVTLVAIPLLLGLGVDDGIHVVHRMLERPDEGLAHSVGAVGRGIALTTATTCASVALLLFTRHPGIQSVAVLLLVGLPLCLLASVTVLPAAARLTGATEVARRRARA